MIEVTINSEPVEIASIEELDAALVRSEQQPYAEIWISLPNGPRMAMLRTEDHAWLMYLRFNGDAGFVSQGDLTKAGTASYTLANGQVDEYPLSWCIDLQRCYQALMYFFVNSGAQPDWVTWQKS
jgi:hypothetical protein